jgi:hypothetical protein
MWFDELGEKIYLSTLVCADHKAGKRVEKLAV